MTPDTLALVLSAISIELTILLGILGFNTKLGKCMTRREHEEICVRREGELKESLNRIEGKIDINEKRASDTRHDIRDSVAALNLKVAVMESRLP